MIQKKRIQAMGLACLIGIMTLAPAAEGLAAVSWAKNNGVYVDSTGTTIAGVVARGIDVSHWKSSINWTAVAQDDVQFVMLGTRYDNAVDPYFQTNAIAASAAGLKVGAYIYSYATTTDMASQEADFVLNLIKDYPISYPVVFDVEDSSLSNLTPQQLADIINTFCDKVKAAGYYPMLYANDHWLSTKIDMSRVKYDVWVARYETKFAYTNAAMWQATNKGSVAGVSGDVDINFAYKDFSASIPLNQWRQIGGKWYYYANYSRQKGWINDGGGWYYMNEDGTQYKGWLHADNKYYYLNDNTGKMALGWVQMPSNSKWYYFKEEGVMATGWTKVENKWFYLNDDGTMATNWLKVNDNTYYYLKADGSMTTGWQQMDNAWYYFNPTGELIRGWADIEGFKYLFGNDGKMYSGWQQIDNNWYCFGSDGKLKTGWQQLDNVWYYLDQSGIMLTGWQQIEQEYYYLHEGKMLTGWLSDSNGNKYYMSPSSGRMIRGWRSIDNAWYYFDQYGHMMKNWITISGKYYYLDPDTGKAMTNATYTINNVNYTFDVNGVCMNDTSILNNITAVTPDTSSGTIGGTNNSSTPGGNTGNSNVSPGGSSTGNMSGTGTPGGSTGNVNSGANAPGGSTGNVNAGTNAPGGSIGNVNSGTNAPGGSTGNVNSGPMGGGTSGGNSSNGFAPGGSSGNNGELQEGLTTGPGKK